MPRRSSRTSGCSAREAVHVRLVDDRLVQRACRGGGRPPSRSAGRSRPTSGSRRRRPRRRARGRRRRLVGRLVGQHVGRVPVHRAVDRLRVRVDQQLVRVEAVALARARRARGRGSRSAGPGRRRAGSSASCARCARSARRAAPSSSPSNRHSSTRSACSEKSEKFVPSPSHVAPSGKGWPGQTASTVIAAALRTAAGRTTWPGSTVAWCVASSELERAVDRHVHGPRGEVGEHEMVAAAHLQPAGVLVVVDRGLAGADRAAGGEQPRVEVAQALGLARRA